MPRDDANKMTQDKMTPMPSDDDVLVGDVDRKTVSFPIELAKAIAKQATRKNRSFSAQVVHDMHIVFERAKRRRLVVVQPPVSHRPMRLEDKTVRGEDDESEKQ